MINSHSIKFIKVRKLFGYFDYDIPGSLDTDISKVLVLYGDNGSGKTTILKILFWLLASRDGSGFKTKLANVKFQSFSIAFQNGLEVGAVRDRNRVIGTYTFYIKRGKKTLYSLELLASDDNRISLPPESVGDLKYREMLGVIRDLEISVFYISDDRLMLNSKTAKVDEQESLISANDSIAVYNSKRAVSLRSRNANRVHHGLSVNAAIDRLYQWITIQTIGGSKIGEKNSNAIFSDLIRRFARPMSTEPAIRDKNALLEEIIELEKKIVPFVNLGLLEHFDGKEIRNSIRRSKGSEQLRYITDLIVPFIDSLNAKINALDKLQGIITLFLESVNDYFSSKTLKFNLTDGFGLIHDSGDDITFDVLSSGEKQLLLLFSNIITSASDAKIFIVDEPEISLNVKWQRKLVATLLQFSRERNIQFVFATHSIELISRNVENVTKLQNSHER